MSHSAQESWQVLATITYHGLVQILVMNAIRQILIPWELFQDSIEEEVAATMASREYEPEATEQENAREDEPEATEGENVGEDDYVDQEELEEMEMEAEAFEEEAAPQEQAETMEPMEDIEVDMERPTSTMDEDAP